MRQILDAFDLLSRTASDHKVEWRLLEAKTSSPPLTITAESSDPAADEQVKEFEQSAEQLEHGELPVAWDEPDVREIARRVLLRAFQGARLEIRGSTPNYVVATWDETNAVRAIEAIATTPERAVSRTKNQMGSIEGEIIAVTLLDKDRKPAVILRERKTGQDISCELSPALAEVLGPHSFREVWERKRVVMRGLIKYGMTGNIRRLIATDADIITPREVSLEEITDTDFTGGLSSVEYIKRLRDGELG